MKIAAHCLLTMAFLAAVPASAQDQQTTPAQPGDEKINQLIVYGDEPCPKSKPDEIVVCVRYDEPFRIPKNLRSDPNDRRKEAWTQRVKAYEYVAATGTGSCSVVGFGGFTGCGINSINAAVLEKAENPGLVFGRLIAEARQKRLAGIDAEAEEIEDVVLAEERAAALKKLQEQADGVDTEAPPGGADDGALPEPEPEPEAEPAPK